MKKTVITMVQLSEETRIGGPTETVSALFALKGDEGSSPYHQQHEGWLLEEEPLGVRAVKAHLDLFFPWTRVAVVRYGAAPVEKAKG